MADLISGLQLIVGLALFLASGYFISLVFFRKDEADLIERALYSLTFSISIPGLVIFFLNFIFRMPINALTTYVVFILLIVASYAYGQKNAGARRKG